MNDDTHTANPADVAGMAGPANRAPGRRCKLGAALDTYPTATAATIVSRLHDPSRQWSDHRLAAIIVESGRPHISRDVMLKHRGRWCACFTPTPSNNTPKESDATE